MIRTRCFRMMLLAGCWAVVPPARAQDEPAFEQRLATLEETYRRTVQPITLARLASTDPAEQGRLEAVSVGLKGTYLADLLALARAEPRSKAVPLALGKIIAIGGTSPAAVDAIEQLRRDWLLEPGVAIACAPMWVCPVPLAEGLLRDVLDRNPDRTARGHACWALARRLDPQGGAGDPAGRAAAPAGPDEANEARARPVPLDRRAEARALCDRVVREFADVKASLPPFPDRGESLGTSARRWLDDHPGPAAGPGAR